MKQLDAGDADEEKAGSGSRGALAEKIATIKSKRGRHKALLEELERSGQAQISLTDPDARAMARSASATTSSLPWTRNTRWSPGRR